MKHVIGSIDNDFAEYAVQMITSTGEIYLKYIVPLNRSYARKVVNGTYDANRAIDGYVNIVDAVLPIVKRAYNEYYECECVRSVSQSTKEIIARELQMEYSELLRDYVKDLKDKTPSRRKIKKRKTKKKVK